MQVGYMSFPKKADKVITVDKLKPGPRYRKLIKYIKSQGQISQEIMFIDTSTFRDQFQ